jgi:type 1 glutamine amidotransferase
MGASFVEHPPNEPLKYAKSCEHSIVNTVNPFIINEEPYMFKMDNLANVTVIMEYIYKDKNNPAAWVRTYGNGRVCYLQPGHTSEAFADESFGLLLERAAMWCVDELS